MVGIYDRAHTTKLNRKRPHGRYFRLVVDSPVGNSDQQWIGVDNLPGVAIAALQFQGAKHFLLIDTQII